jgi:hypothetical protein
MVQEQNQPAGKQSAAVEEIDDWITVREACRLVTNRETGKRTNISLIYRWILKGHLVSKGKRVQTMVSRKQVLALLLRQTTVRTSANRFKDERGQR